jgi:CHAT domain-containing protein/Tfp pilus assembly protein PilF
MKLLTPRRGVFVLAALLCFLPAQLFCQQATPLTPGTALERALKGGESHSFQISLTAGQFLHVSVEQEGIDVEVILFGPKGERISHTDSQNGLWGPEPAVVIAEQSGVYQVQVDSPDKSASEGRYEIRIVALRDATDDDRKHVAAEHLMEQGQDLSLEQAVDALRAALADLNQALPYYESSPDGYRFGLLLYTLGAAHAASSEFPQALGVYARALPQFQRLGDRRMTGVTLNNMGGAYDVLGELQKALDFYDRALAESRAVGDSSNQAFALNNIGKINADMANWQKAVEYYSQALAIFHSLGNLPQEANTTHNIGANYLLLGQPEMALDYFRRALALSETAGDKQIQANCLGDIGNSYLALGQNAKALESYQQALALRYAVGDQWLTGYTLLGLAHAYVVQGDQEKALSNLQKALELFKTVEDRRNQGITLEAIGQAYLRINQPGKALEYETQALALLEQVQDVDDEAKAHLGMARADRDTGNLNEARKQVETAISEVEQSRSHAGAPQQRASYFANQQGPFEFYIDLLMRLHQQDPTAGYDEQALQVSERARARSLLEMLSEAHVDFREGVDQKLLDRENSLSQLLNTKSRRLLELSGPGVDSQREALKKEIGELEAEYQQVEVSIRTGSPRYAEITEPQPLSVKDIQRTLDSNTLLLEYSLGDERSYVWAVTTDSLKSYELAARREIEPLVRQVYEALTARSTYPRGEMPNQKQERIAKADSQLPDAAAKLSSLILDPVASQLGDKRLALVTDGALQHIPFAMLPLPSGSTPTPLVAEHEIVNLPSASTLPILRQVEDRKPAPGMVAVLADPVFEAADPRVKSKTVTIAAKRETSLTDGNSRLLEQLAEDASDSTTDAAGHLRVPRLPFTREEAARIVKVAPGKDNLEALDFRASLETATSPELSHYRYLHFATHGYLDSEHPELSAIVLSLVDEHGGPREGFLRANDIYNLKLPADLVVLSACQTGLGKEIRGEGIVGLTRGFMYAGVPRVIVSLWSVNDRATEELMAKFYEKLLKENLRPSAALRDAQVEMWKQKSWSAPYYWAAFVQQGDWK